MAQDSEAEEYHRRAQRWEAFAKRAYDPDIKKQYLILAEQLRTLAAQRERLREWFANAQRESLRRRVR